LKGEVQVVLIKTWDFGYICRWNPKTVHSVRAENCVRQRRNRPFDERGCSTSQIHHGNEYFYYILSV